MSEDETSAALRQLMRGLSHDGMQDTYLGYKALYGRGEEVVPAIEALIFQRDWNALDRPRESHILAALVSLVHDIDESESRRIIRALKAKGCKPVISRYLDAIAGFSLENFRSYEAHGITVFESMRIGRRQRVETRLGDWLATVPAAHLEGIERIYVVTHSEDKEYGGMYMPLLCHITVVWRHRHPRVAPISWFFRLFHEFTLYHEIGHHCLGHTFGQDPEQEKQANDYAGRLIRANHPWLAKVGRVLTPAVRPLVPAIKEALRYRRMSQTYRRQSGANQEPTPDSEI